MEDMLTSLHVLDAIYPYALGTFGVLLCMVAVLESQDMPRRAAQGKGNAAVRGPVLP